MREVSSTFRVLSSGPSDPLVVPTVFAARDVALLLEIDGEEIDRIASVEDGT